VQNTKANKTGFSILKKQMFPLENPLTISYEVNNDCSIRNTSKSEIAIYLAADNMKGVLIYKPFVL
jgi:hypothetical protein